MLLDVLEFSLLLMPFAFFWVNCPCCPDEFICDACDSDVPQYLDVTFSGIVEGTSPCGSCDDLNATFTLEWQGACQWIYDPLGENPAPCGYTISLQMIDQEVFDGTVIIRVFLTNGAAETRFEAIVSAPLDCTSLTSVSMSTDMFHASNLFCDTFGASASLSTG